MNRNAGNVMKSTDSFRILRGDILHGPYPMKELQRLFSLGRFKPGDLVSIDGNEWLRPEEVLNGRSSSSQSTSGTFPEGVRPAPTATPLSNVPIRVAWRPDVARIIGAYRILAIVGLVGLLGPWYAVSASSNVPQLIKSEFAASLPGYMIAQGMLYALLITMAFCVSWFMRDWKTLVGIPALALLISVLGWAPTPFGATPFNMEIDGAFGGAHTSMRAGLGWGYWCSVLASGAMVAIATLMGLMRASGEQAVRLDPSAAGGYVPSAHHQQPSGSGSGRSEGIGVPAVIFLVCLAMLTGGAAIALLDDEVREVVRERLKVRAPAVPAKPALKVPGGRVKVEVEADAPEIKNVFKGGFAEALQNIATHQAAADVEVYEAEILDIKRNDLLNMFLGNQALDNLGDPLRNNAKKHLLSVEKGTALRVIKPEILHGGHMVHFVRILSGPNSGKEGWVADAVLRPAF